MCERAIMANVDNIHDHTNGFFFLFPKIKRIEEEKKKGSGGKYHFHSHLLILFFF